jgi:hypothetical protein
VNNEADDRNEQRQSFNSSMKNDAALFWPGGKARNETAGRSAGATKTSRAQAHARPCREKSVKDMMRKADSQ